MKMSNPKKIKNLQLIKIIKELKNLEAEIIIESTKRKLSAIEKAKINKIKKLEEDFRIETTKRRMK